MLRRLFKRLSQDEGELRAQDIRSWVAGIEGVTAIAAVEPRSVAKVAGVVETVRVRPREGVQAFEAVINDGSGAVTAVWLGRRKVTGLAIGSRLIVQGRFGGARGALQVMNPTFEFAPSEPDE